MKFSATLVLTVDIFLRSAIPQKSQKNIDNSLKLHFSKKLFILQELESTEASQKFALLEGTNKGNYFSLNYFS